MMPKHPTVFFGVAKIPLGFWYSRREADSRLSDTHPPYGRPAKGSRYFGRRPFRLRGPEETLYPLGQQCDA